MLLLWRRMALWQITSYRSAVDTELDLRRAVTLLRVRYGRRWHHYAPADLVWMLRTGVGVSEACEQVRVLVNVKYAAKSSEVTISSSVGDAAPVCRMSRRRVLRRSRLSIISTTCRCGRRPLMSIATALSRLWG